MCGSRMVFVGGVGRRCGLVFAVPCNGSNFFAGQLVDMPALGKGREILFTNHTKSITHKKYITQERITGYNYIRQRVGGHRLGKRYPIQEHKKIKLTY